MKRCTRCKVDQSTDQFAPQPNNGDGLHAHCRTCAGERWKKWFRESYSGEFAEGRRRKSRDYYQANRAAVAERERLRRIAQRAAETIEQREVRLARRRARYVARGEVARMKALDYAHTRTARKQGNSVTPVDFAAILTDHGMTCHLCGGDIASRADLHFDHVVPLSKGGPHTPENIRPAHAFCNLSKGARTEVEA